ncbi:MAG: PDZ domain-containing protein, partial [Isosphaeraceae bacterium]
NKRRNEPTGRGAGPGWSAKRLAWLPTLVGVLALAAFGGATRGQSPPSAEQKAQIEAIKKQIEELNQKLEAIVKGGEPKTSAPKSLTPGPEWVKPLAWRSIGPANMGGRVTALAVYEADPSTFWVATGGGGLLKTVNNGITFEHQFDKESTVAIGDVAVAASDKNVVWVGTGEGNPRNSVSYGDGVYKSTDGGKTWTNMGLKDSYQIGRIVIHPKDPNVVYVGALGRLYGPSQERGLFKTTDGGKTWEKILYVDDKTGIIDLKMNPNDPETLVAATYERLRDIYDVGDPVKKWGEGSGIHKTTDGGKTWSKLTKGLPTVKYGRVGLEYYRKDPNTLFAIIETEKIGTGPRPKNATNQQAYMGIVGEGPEAAGAVIGGVTAGGPAEKAGVRVGDKVESVDGKEMKTYADLVELLRDKKVGDKLKLKLERDAKPIELEVTLEARPTGPGGGGGGGGAGAGVEPGGEATGLGLNPDRPFGASLGGQIENAQDRQGPDGFQTGGVYKSTDGGESWTRINSLNPRPFYFSQVRVDPSDEKYQWVLGIALHRSEDGGKTFRGDGGRGVHADHHALWIDPKDGRHAILGCDGGIYVTYDRGANWDHHNHNALGQFYHVALDSRRNYRAYGGLQDNGSWGGPSISRSGEGPINEDWLNVGGGDGFHCAVDPTDPDVIYATSQYGVLTRRNLRTGEAARISPVAEKGVRYRFNWDTPFLLSSHNPKIYYTAANHVFRSLNQGNDLRPISPDVTRTQTGSATALAESPKNPDVLYVGTDDGNLWGTRDGGKTWTDLTKNVGLDRFCYVETIEASRFEEGRAYVAFDGHRSDTDDPLVFVTEDFGKTWKSLKANLPRGSTRCLREDAVNPNLLYVGTEFAVWASLDRGESWTKINNNLPTVSVMEIAVHPTAGEIVAATHGRSLWALDVNGLRQLNPEVITKAKATLLKPITAIRWRSEPNRGGTNRRFVGQNPPRGAQLYVALSAKPEKGASLKVVDYDGATVYEARVPSEVGLHKLTWPLTRPAPRPAQGQAGGGGGGGGGGGRGGAGGGGGGGGGGGFLGRRGFGPPAAPGTYKVVLTVDGQESSQALKVESDPDYPNPPEIGEGAFEGLGSLEADDDDDDRDEGRFIDHR